MPGCYIFEVWHSEYDTLGTRPPEWRNAGSDAGRSRYLLGLFFILLQCVVWISASVLTQYLYGEEEFHSPFLMTYVGVSLNIVFLPLKLLTDRFGCSNELSAASCDSFDDELAQSTHYNDILATVASRSHILGRNVSWNHKKHLLAALNIAPAIFIADWAYNGGLAHTSIASSTVFVNTTCAFVFLFAVFVKVEKFSFARLLGVILAVLGTTLTALNDASNEDEAGDRQSLLGDLYSLIAAIGYATYTVQARVLCPQDEDLYSMQILLGYVGLCCSIPLLPVAIFSLNSVKLSWSVIGVLACKGMLDFVITDYLLLRSVVLTNATVASVGLGLTIPLAFLVDWAMGKLDSFSPASLLGALAVAAGFLIVNLTGHDEPTPDALEQPVLEKETVPKARSGTLV